MGDLDELCRDGWFYMESDVSDEVDLLTHRISALKVCAIIRLAARY